MIEPSFYNTLTKQIEALVPKNLGQVRIYNCGPTVYKRQHLGNMRRFLFADFLRRSLELLGYEVREITNITDVGHLTADDLDAGEDKIEKVAIANKTTPQEIAKQQTKLFLEDLSTLNIQPAHSYPRASAHIKHMQNLISRLIERGHAYQVASGVYFDIASFPSYGLLSGNKLSAIEAGSRVEVREEKKNPADFALWVNDDQHLQKWDSPWGVGYPGWHVECSAMSLEYLGSEIDIHTGGEDNIFPHHENEIAQSEASTGETFVKIWMHNRHLQVNGRKLAKREGEQITIDSITEKGLPPLAFRLLVFGSHYRQPLDFSWETMAAAAANLAAIKQTLRLLLVDDPTSGEPEKAVLNDFSAALADDLNTPRALAVFSNYLKTINTALSTKSDKSPTMLATLLAMDKVVGVVQRVADEITAEVLPDEVKKLAEDRETARKDRNFDQADVLRLKIEDYGYYLEDTPTGPRLIKKDA